MLPIRHTLYVLEREYAAYWTQKHLPDSLTCTVFSGFAAQTATIANGKFVPDACCMSFRPVWVFFGCYHHAHGCISSLVSVSMNKTKLHSISRLTLLSGFQPTKTNNKNVANLHVYDIGHKCVEFLDWLPFSVSIALIQVWQSTKKANVNGCLSNRTATKSITGHIEILMTTYYIKVCLTHSFIVEDWYLLLDYQRRHLQAFNWYCKSKQKTWWFWQQLVSWAIAPTAFRLRISPNLKLQYSQIRKMFRRN